jgi:hypothetical protein
LSHSTSASNASRSVINCSVEEAVDANRHRANWYA